MICFRLKASSWRVKRAARCPPSQSPRFLRDRLLVGMSVEQQLAVSEDRGQQIVEVVRHAAGQPADGLHLLRLPELLFTGRSACSARFLSIRSSNSRSARWIDGTNRPKPMLEDVVRGSPLHHVDGEFFDQRGRRQT